MRIFQVMNGICHWDATSQYPTLESTVGKFAPNVIFVEAPDHVREGWGYLNGEFIRPEPPPGWLYDEETGTYYPKDAPRPTPAEKREQAYNYENIIPWGDKELTVTGASVLWQYYAAEGSEKAQELTALIKEAKATIRERYPDESAE